MNVFGIIPPPTSEDARMSRNDMKLLAQASQKDWEEDKYYGYEKIFMKCSEES